MKEKDIENLIATYPDDFFPGGAFKLLGQQAKVGRCFIDVLFRVMGSVSQGASS